MFYGKSKTVRQLLFDIYRVFQLKSRQALPFPPWYLARSIDPAVPVKPKTDSAFLAVQQVPDCQSGKCEPQCGSSQSCCESLQRDAGRNPDPRPQLQLVPSQLSTPGLLHANLDPSLCCLVPLSFPPRPLNLQHRLSSKSPSVYFQPAQANLTSHLQTR